MLKQLLRTSLVIGFILFFSNLLFCQNIDINYINPDFVDVCNKGKFEFSLTNKGNDNLTNITVEITLPIGLDYISGSITNGTEINISNPSKPVFSLPDFQTELNFNFEAEANCSLFEDINSGKLFRNNITIEYDQGRDRIETLPYKIETGLLVITNVEPTNLSGAYGETVERRITVKNTRLGKIDEFIFSDYNGWRLTVSTNGNDTLRVSGWIGIHEAIFDGSHFQNIGNGDQYLDFNEEFVIIETIIINECIEADLDERVSDIRVRWGCNDKTCQLRDAELSISLEEYTKRPFLEVSAEINSIGEFCETDIYSEKLTVSNTGDGLARNMRFTVYSSGPDKDLNSISVTNNGIDVPFTVSSRYPGENPNCPLNFRAGFSVMVDTLSPNEVIEIRWENNFCGTGCDLKIPDLSSSYSYNRECPIITTSESKIFTYPFSSLIRDSISYNFGGAVFDGGEYELRYDLSSPILNDSSGLVEVEFTLPCGYSWSSTPMILDGKEPLTTDIDNSDIQQTVVTLQYELPFSVDSVWGNFYLNFDCLPDCNVDLEFDRLGFLSSCPAFFLECYFTDFETSLVDVSGTLPAGQPDLQSFKVESSYISKSPNINCTLSDCESFNLVNLCGGDIVNIQPHVFEAYIDFDSEFRRENIGLKDSDDDRKPDDGSKAPLNEIRADRFVPGDTALTQLAGLVVNDLLPIESENVKFRVCFEGHINDNGTDDIEDIPDDLFRLWSGIRPVGAFVKIVDKDTGLEYQCPIYNSRTKGDVHQISIINTRPTENFDAWRLLSFSYELDLTSASQIQGSTIPPDFKLTEGDSIYFEARHQIAYNPDRKIINLRHYTEGTIFNGNSSIEEQYSCGRPSHNFQMAGYRIIKYAWPNSALPCEEFDGGGTAFSLSFPSSNFFTNEVRQFAKLIEWTLEIPEAYRLVSSSIREMGMTGSQSSVENEPVVFNRDGNRYSLDLQQYQDPIFDEGFSVTFDHRFITEREYCGINTSGNREYKLITTTNFLNDFARLSDTVTHTETRSSGFQMSNVKLSLTADDPSYLSNDFSAKWDLTLQNTGQDGENFWMAIESKTQRITNFILKDKSNNQEIVPSNGIYNVRNVDEVNFELEVDHAVCGSDNLNVYYGWDCNPVVNTDQFSCQRDSLQLSISAPHTQIPQFEMIIDSPPDSVILCDTVPYHTIEILNADLGTAFNLDLSVLMPTGISILPGSSEIAYTTASNNFVPVTDPEDLGNGSYFYKINDIQQTIKENGLPSVINQPDNSFSLRFLSFTNCRSLASAPPIITATGLSFCDEPSNTLTKPGDLINIEGVFADYSAIISLITIDQNPVVTCGDELELFAEIEFSGNTVEGDSILITLPPGITYVDNSYQPVQNATNVSPVITPRGDFTVLSLPIPPGLMVNEALQFKLNAFGFGAAGCKDELIQIQTIQTKSAFCKTINDFCEVFVQSGSTLVNVEVDYPSWTFQTFLASDAPNGIEYEIRSFNWGDFSNNPIIIDFYKDEDGNGLVSIGDTFLGTQLVDSTNIQNRSFEISGYLNTTEQFSCNIIAIVSSSKNCTCRDNQIGITSQTLSTQTLSACSNVPLGIGVPDIIGATYSWDNSTNLSCSNCPNPMFVHENLTDSIQVFNYVLTETGGGCNTQYLIVVEVFPIPEILTNEQEICEGESVQLTTSPIQSITWTGSGISNQSDTNIVVTPSQTTTYYASFSCGNCTKIDSVTIEVTMGPIANTGADTSFCDVSGGIALSAFYDPNYTYVWEPSSLLSDFQIHNPIVLSNVSSDFILTVKDEQTGCSLKDTISVEFGFSPQLSTSNDITICKGDSVSLFVDGADSYAWSNSNSLDCDNCQTVTAFPATTTTYSIIGTSTNGSCKSKDSITVFVVGAPQFIDETVFLCEGDSLEINGVFYSQNTEVTIVTPSLQDGCDSTHTVNLIINSQFIEEDYLLCEGDSVSLYDKTIKDMDTSCGTFIGVDGCDSTHCFNVRMIPVPDVSFDSISYTVIREDSTLISLPDDFAGYRWEPSLGLQCDTCQTTMASPTETTVYTGFVLNEEGCAVRTRSVRIEVFNKCSAQNLTIPNIFSPNGDSRNEIFKPLGVGVEEIISLKIFNRWGQKVYDGRGNSAQWDGSYNRENQPAGVYIYMVEIGCGDEREEPIVGDVTLLR